MKRFAYLMIFFLLLPLTNALTFEDVLEQGMPYETAAGRVYLYTPTTVHRGQFVEIGLLLIDPEGNNELTLTGAMGEPQYLAGDTPEGEPYVLATWVVYVAEENELHLTLASEDIVHLEQPIILSPATTQATQAVTSSETLVLAQQDTSAELAALRDQLQEQGMSYTLNEFEQARRAGSDIVIERRADLVTIDGAEKTVVTLAIMPAEAYASITIIELIPKEFAATASELYFPVEPIVLQEDPVVMWQLEDIADAQSLQYEVAGRQEVTGNTVILAKPLEEEMHAPWRVIVPLLLIPIIGLLIVFFARFSPGEKKQ